MKRAQARDARAGAGGGAPVPDKHREAIAGPGKCLFAVSIRPKDLDAEEGRYARATPARSRTRRPSHSSAPARPPPPARTRRFARTRAATRVPGRPAVFAFPRAFDATRVRRAPPPPFPPHRVAPFPPARPLPSRRALVLASLASLPPRYRVLETDRGAIAYLGGDRPDRGCFAPQVLSRGDAAVALVSPTLPASRVADAFTAAIASSDDPKRRALALKAALRALGTNARFSFALLDLRTGRVFAASTALSSPLAVGHAPDGTLLVACTRSGAKAATHWPPRWAGGGGGGDHSSASCRVNDGSARGGPKGAPAVVSGGGASSLSPPRANAHASHSPLSVLPSASRCVSPATTDRSRSRSPGAWSTHSSGSSTSAASDASWRQREAAAGAARSGTRLTHLPAGRFVYGRNYLQPFEFSAFWSSGGGGGGGGARGDDEAGDATPGRTRECGSDVMRSGGAREIATEDAKAREGSEGSWRGRGGGDVDPHQRPAPRGFAPRREEEKKKHAEPEDAGGSPFPARGVSETDAERSPAAFQGRRYSRVAWTAGPATRPSDAASTWRASAANAKGGESGGEESRDARLGAAPPRALDQDEVGTPKKPEAGGPAIAEPNAGAEVEANAEAEAEANANADSSASDGPSSPFKSWSSPVVVPTTSRASSAARSRLTWPGAPRDASRGRAPTPDPEMMLDLSRAVAAARWAGGAGAGAGARPGPPRPAAPGDGSLEDLRASWPAPPPPAGGGPRTRARSALARGGGSLDALLSLGVEEEERRRGGASSVERGWPSAAGGGGRGPDARGGARRRVAGELTRALTSPAAALSLSLEA